MAKGARAARERTRSEENIVKSFGVKRRSGREKESGRAESDGLNWQDSTVGSGGKKNTGPALFMPGVYLRQPECLASDSSVFYVYGKPHTV